MPFVIDGHNLIGADPDIRLEDPEDEARLIRRLERFSRAERRRITVYFDRGQLAGTDPRAGGLVSVRFSRTGIPADTAILNHIRSLGGAARNWTVVTSDRALQAAVRELGARVQRSEDFLAEMSRTATPSEDRARESEMPAEELEEWLRLFRQRRDDGPET